MNSNLKEQLTEIFNGAHFSTEKRSELLSSAFELIFYRDPGLLDEHYENLIHFALDRSAAIKKQIISFIEQICKKFPNQFNNRESKNYLLKLLTDQNKSVVKRTILCIINITKSILSYILNPSTTQSGNEALNDFNELKQKIIQIHSQTDDESIKTNTFKFLEVLVLSFSSPGEYTSRKMKSDDEFCLDKVPLEHPVLSRAQIQEESDSCLHILIDSAKDLSDMTSTNIMILITSLTNISRQRFSLIPTIVPVICTCPSILPKLQTVQNESVKHSFKANLLSIIKLKHSAVQPYIKPLIEALSSVDAKDQGEEAAKWYRGEPEKKKRQYIENSSNNNNNNNMENQQMDQLQKKIKTDSDQQQNINSNYIPQIQELPSLLLDRDTQNVILQALPNLQLNEIIKMVIDNFSNVPVSQILQNIPYNQQTEKLFQFVNSYQNINQPPIPFSIYNLYGYTPIQNQGFIQPSPPMMPIHIFNYPKPNSPLQQPQVSQFVLPPQINKSPNLVSSPPPSIPNAFVNTNQPTPFDPRIPIQQQDISEPILDEEEEEDDDELKGDDNEVDEDEIKFEEKLNSTEPIQSGLHLDVPMIPIQNNSDNNEEHVPQTMVIKPTFEIKPLSSEISLKMRLSAFNRMKSSEDLVAVSGKLPLWTSLLAKMISIIPDVSDKEENNLIDFILNQFESRKDLALQWLQNEFFIAKQINNQSEVIDSIDNRYNNLLSKLFEKMKLTFTPSEHGKLICSFILDLPLITDQLFQSILSLNEYSNIDQQQQQQQEDGKPLINTVFELTSDDDVIFNTGYDNLEDQWSMLSLKILRDVVIWRPTNRIQCLNSLLEFSISLNDKTIIPTIKLITNQLYSKSSITDKIQIFAKDQILKLLNIDNILEYIDNNTISIEEMHTEEVKVEAENKEEEDQEKQEKEKPIITDSQKIANFIERKLYLFFSLCTKNHNLITDLLEIYPKCKDYLQTSIQKMIYPVTKIIGQSNSSFLQVLSICPEGSQSLMIEILKSLVENDKPSQELVVTVKKLISIQDDPRFLLPIVNGLEKEEIIQKLPVFIGQPPKDAESFIAQLSQPSSPISPSELLVQLHMIESKELTKRSMEAIDYCFQMKNIFTQEFIAVTIQQLIVFNPLPKLLMRTMIKSLQFFPSLKSFVVENLYKLVGRQIWNDEQLWSGFVLCAKAANPDSFNLILQLPTPQFKSALQKDSERASQNGQDLKSYLTKYLKAKTTNPAKYPKENIKVLNDFGKKIKEPN